MSFQIIESDPQPAVAVRVITSLEEMPEVVGRSYQQVFGQLAAAGVQPAGMPFICYHTMDMAALDIEIGVAVERPVAGEAPVGATTIAGGRRGVAVHHGPYEQLAEAYHGLTEWLTAQGEKPSGLTYEYYANAPDEVPASELETRIELLLT